MEEISSISLNYLSELKSTLDCFPMEQLHGLGKLLFERKEKSTLFIAGNGGSASTASHMATDLGVGSIRRANPIRAVSLCENSSVLTALSNDINFDEVFATQLNLLAKPGDILITFSASGNSKNILKAIAQAKSIGVYSVAITGFDGGAAKKIADASIHIETKIGSYGIVEDVHSTISHMLTELVRHSNV
jgi:D-sedoheptulose 7-phosphate isomerase